MKIKTKILLIFSILNFFFINAIYAHGSIGQTEITQWQYGKKGAVSITYDDGTINQFRVAVPIMNRLGLPGTFYIITGSIPGSKYVGKFLGRPVGKIIEEAKTIPTNADNVFERASAARFSGYKGTGSYFTRAGAAIDAHRMEEAIGIIDGLYKRIAAGEFEPEITGTGRRTNTADVLTWDMIKTHAVEGHEFASHMITHPYMCALDDANIKYELEKSRREILKRIGIRHTVSAELPYGTQNDRALQAALKLYPVTRNRIAEDYVLELHRPSRQTPVNSDFEYVFWERGIISNTSLDEMNGWVDVTAENNNIWLVTVIHGIDGIGWEAITAQDINAHFSHIKSREDDVWVATFADAARYIKQRMNAKVSFSLKEEKINVKLTHPLNKRIYDIPLTLKTYVNPEWRAVDVKQGNSVLRVDVQHVEGEAYILYQAMPGKGTIVLTAANT